MNKQKNRYTPFKGKYRMHVDEFCDQYHIDIKVIMHRLNVKGWEDYDALVIPQNMGDTSADKIRRALVCLGYGWSKESIAKYLSIDKEVVDNIDNMSSYMKTIFLDKMKNYFFLDPDAIDLDQVFGRK